MKTFIKFISLLIVLSVTTAMCLGCLSIDEGTKAIVPSLTENGDLNAEESSNTATEDNSKNESITISEQVLFEENGIKVTAKEITNDIIMGMGMKVLIENSTTKNITVGAECLAVNNYMITDLFSCDITAEKKSNEIMYFTSTQLEQIGIKNIGQIDVIFNVYNSDSFDRIFQSDLITIKTSAFENMDIPDNAQGTELLNSNGIKIVGKFVDEHSFWGTSVVLYLENKTGKRVTVSCENLSINGFTVSEFFVCDILDGKMAVDTITIFDEDLQTNDIESVEDIEVSFKAYESETFDVIIETEPIKFSAK